VKILIVEDDVIPANYLKQILIKEGYEVVDIITKGKDVLSAVKKYKPEVIFMDIMLKDNISGAEVSKEINNMYPKIAIIFLTAYSDKEIVDYAVESNAFAYLLKPYRVKEILATLELVKNKITTQKPNNVKNKTKNMIDLVNSYSFDISINRLFKNGKEVVLGKKPLQLIEILCKNPHVTMEISTIIEKLWDEPKSGQTLRSLICRVREATCYDLIQNSNKFGYKIGLNPNS